jgi:hypothetical protein
LLCIATIPWLLVVMHCCFFVAIDSLLLCVTTPHSHVLLAFLKFSLLCTIVALQFLVVGHHYSSWLCVATTFQSSLLCTTTIPLSTSLTCCCSLALHWCALLLFPLIVVVWLLQYGTTPNLCFWASEGVETWNSSLKLYFSRWVLFFFFFLLSLFLLFFHCVCMCFVNMYVFRFFFVAYVLYASSCRFVVCVKGFIIHTSHCISYLH